MAVTTGTVNKPYISAVSFLDKREIYRQIIDQYQDDEWLDFLTDAQQNKIFAPGNEQSSVPVYHSFQNDPLYVLLDTTGATVTLSGASNNIATVTGLGSSAQNLLVAGMLLYLPGGQVLRVQTVPSASSFTARTVDGSTMAGSPSNTFTAGMKLSVFSNAQEEGSNGVDPLRWSLSSISNRIQIFSNSIKLTDVQVMSGVEVEVNGQAYILPYEAIRGMQRHRGDISLAFWLGKISDTLFSDSSPLLAGANGNGVQTTRGMDQYITTYGIQDTVATPGTFVLADIKDINTQLTAQRAPMEYIVAGAQEVVSTYSDFFKNLNSSGVESVRIQVNGRELDMEVEKFKYGGRTFNLKSLNVLSNDQVINYIGTGSSKITPAKSAYYLPMGTTPVQGQGQVPYFRYRYMKPMAGIAGASQNRTITDQTVEIVTGGLAPIPTSNEKAMRIEWTSNMGLEVFNPNKFLRSVTLA